MKYARLTKVTHLQPCFHLCFWADYFTCPDSQMFILLMPAQPKQYIYADLRTIAFVKDVGESGEHTLDWLAARISYSYSCSIMQMIQPSTCRVHIPESSQINGARAVRSTETSWAVCEKPVRLFGITILTCLLRAFEAGFSWLWDVTRKASKRHMR